MRRGLTVVPNRRLRPRRYRSVWIDVGAHEGETTIGAAAARRDLIVYAFEPNLAVAARTMGRLANFVMIPMAVALEDGSAELKISAFDASSSLLDIDPGVAERWIGGGSDLDVVERITVPTIRLDTFMKRAGIEHVDFLKIDAQGADLDVVKSAGNRLRDIARVKLEVTKGRQLYRGAADAAAAVDYMKAHGFALIAQDEQSHGQEENLTFERR